jgi:integrase
MPDRPRLTRVAGRDTWHIYDARRRISTGCTDRAEAEAALAAYLRGHDKPAAASVSIALILDRYLATRKDKAVPGLARLEWAHKPLRRFWGERPPGAVTEAECLAYARRRAKDASGPHGKPAGPATIRTELQALRAALRWAADAGGLIAAAPGVPLPPRPAPRERWLEREEADRLIAACRSPHVRLFVLLALHTAARKAAILDLTWDRVDLDRSLIDLRAPGRTQTRKRRVPVPINATLAAALRVAHAARVSEWVVEYGGGKVADVKHGFARAAAAAGLEQTTPHTLRHTAATWMVQSGVPLWDVAGMLGNTVAMVEEVYGHHSSSHLRRAADALG